MEQLIAYRVLVQGKEKERGDCTEQEWETQRKQEVAERWKGTGYRVRLWPPPKWRRRDNA